MNKELPPDTENLYQAPKADSEFEFIPPPKWSKKKLYWTTLLPALLVILCGFSLIVPALGMIAFMVALFAIPVFAFVNALRTGVYFARQNNSEAMGYVGFILLWITAHAGLLFLGFLGCAAVISVFNVY